MENRGRVGLAAQLVVDAESGLFPGHEPFDGPANRFALDVFVVSVDQVGTAERWPGSGLDERAWSQRA